MTLTSFDHHDAVQMLDPYPGYAELRARCPVAHSDRHGGFWVVAGYDDVVAVAQDHDRFRSGDGIAVPTVIGTRVEPQESDPPRHTSVRALMVPWLSVPAVAAIEPLVRSVSASLLDAWGERTEVELVADYATPLASLVMLNLLGCPEAVVPRLQDDIDATLHSPDDPARRAAGAGDLAECVAGLVVDRRERLARAGAPPPDDLLGRIVSARIDDAPVTDAEAVSLGLSLVFAGFETSANAIATAVFHLAQRPDLWARLRAEPALVSTAVEELLRYVSPVQVIGRTAAADDELGGVPIAAGDTVMIAYGSANHDPSVFTDPGDLQLDRAPNRHVAFGSGIHRCVGRHLGRLELRVALADLVARIARCEIADPAGVAWSFGENRGVRALPLRVTRAS
ncbi:MAG: cytochrome P450 [Acidimicrobiia bacterium]